MEGTLVALAACLLYVAVSLVVGDRFPFSRYSMYAKLRGREEGAVLVIRADGVELPFYELARWHGVDPAALDPAGVPCSLQWVAYEARRWVEQHTVASAEGLPLEVEVGWRILRVDPQGRLLERFEPRGRGRGARR